MQQQGRAQRVSPAWVGIAIGGTLLLILIVTETVLGRWSNLTAGGDFDALARVSGGMLRDLRIAIVHCLVAGYVSAALLYVVQNGRRTVTVLQEALNCTAAECETLAASVTLSSRGMLIMAIIGLPLAFLTPYIVPPVPPSPWDPSTWPPEVYWHRLLGPAIFVLQLWLGYAVVTVSLRMSRIAKQLSDIDLLDQTPLAPFTQLGLTNALLLIGLLSIWSPMMIETGFGHMMLLIGSITLIMSAIALLAPVQGVHKRIRQCKETELAWLNTAVANQRIALRDSVEMRVGGEMADLVAYRTLVESVPEWPFTTSTYTRIVLYALIPLASWGIGVFAEELLARFLFG